MIKLLKKEMVLSASPLTYIFIVFGLMSFLPGYPILVGSFFVCLGIFQSFQKSREENDIIYTALLPVAKSDIVKSKYTFCVVIELLFFFLTSIPVLIRMTLLSDASVYRNNPLMNANLVYLAYVLLILGLFNFIFVRGFFKTAYKFGKPFVLFIISAFLIVALGETLFHIPYFSSLNSFGFTHLILQGSIFCIGIIIFISLTIASIHFSTISFDKIDL